MANETGSAIAGAAVSALGNYAIQAAANKRQFKFQKEAMGLQQQYNKDLWDYQNAYNTPQQQMARLKAAGLNPYLIYGSGSANTGNAGAIAPAEVPSREAARGSVPDFGSRYLDARLRDAQYNATVQNTDNARIKADLMQQEQALNNLKLMRESLRSKNYEALTQAEKQTAEFVARRSAELFANEKSKGALLDQMHDQRGKMFGMDVALKGQKVRDAELENEFKEVRNNMAQYGIYSSDNYLFRAMVTKARRMGMSVDQMMDYWPKSMKELWQLISPF